MKRKGVATSLMKKLGQMGLSFHQRKLESMMRIFGSPIKGLSPKLSIGDFGDDKMVSLRAITFPPLSKGLLLQRGAGFTLIEIMIVVGIVALLAALAIPNFLKSRIHANEGVTQDALKTIATAEISFRSANSVYASLEELGAANPSYIDSVLSSGARSGYTFTITDIDNDSTFHCSAKPDFQDITGVRSFCITEDGVVRTKVSGGDINDRDACLLLPPIG